MIADSLKAYFGADASVRRNHYAQFLQMLGGTIAGGVLTNRPAVEATVAARLEAFGALYIISRFGPIQGWSSRSELPKAAQDVAQRFIDWLVQRRR